MPCPTWKTAGFAPAGGASAFGVLFECVCRFTGRFAPAGGASAFGVLFECVCRFTGRSAPARVGRAGRSAAVPNRSAAGAEAIRDGEQHPASAACRRSGSGLEPPPPPARVRGAVPSFGKACVDSWAGKACVDSRIGQACVDSWAPDRPASRRRRSGTKAACREAESRKLDMSGACSGGRPCLRLVEDAR